MVKGRFTGGMLIWLLLAMAVVVLDQWTKASVVSRFELYERINVLPIFDITLARNTGAAFSFLADAGGWQRWFFSIIAIVVSVGLTIWLARMNKSEVWLAVAVALILGGALGNVIDRVLLGYVVDFLLFYWRDYYFPAFNVADMAISIGGAMLALDIIRDARDQRRAMKTS